MMRDYLGIAKEKFEKLKIKDDIIILAIETSCDETAVAVTSGRKVLSSVISSQIEIHKRFGGVVPEIASRNHTLAIDNMVKEALLKAAVSLKDVEVIAVTYGAGLLGALIVGVAYAKSLAYGLKIPLIGINHIKGHIFANFVEDEIPLPFISLIASGGHTAILKVASYNNIEILGETQDDAVGEAFDKVARVLGLDYPGGPKIQLLAEKGRDIIPMPRSYKGEAHFNFSFSGLKTSVINYIHKLQQKGEEIPKEDIACSFQEEATGVLVDNALRAIEQSGIKRLVVAGGVAANDCLRKKLIEQCSKENISLSIPQKAYCTDNAVMIAIACYFAIKDNIDLSNITLDADAGLSMVKS